MTKSAHIPGNANTPPLFDKYGRSHEGKVSTLRRNYEAVVLEMRPHLKAELSTKTTDELIAIINHESDQLESETKTMLQRAMVDLEECLTRSGLEAIKERYFLLAQNAAFLTAVNICEKEFIKVKL